MKFFLSLLAFFSIGFSLIGQDISEISFENNLLCWQDYKRIDSLSSYKQNFELVQEPAIIDDEFVLFVNNATSYDNEGYLIELRDINNGDIIWQKDSFSETIYSRNYINNFLIKENILQVYLLEESREIFNMFYPPWNNGHIYLLEIDIYTGEVLTEIKTDHTDSNNVILFKNLFATRNFYSFDSGKFREINSSYTNISRTNNTTTAWFSVSYFDTFGHLLTTDTTYYDLPFIDRNPFANNAVYNHSGSYSLTIGGQMLNDSIFGKVILIDETNSFTEVDITKHLQERPDEYFLTSMKTEGNKLAVTSTSLFSLDHFSASCYLFTIDSELLDSIHISYTPNEKEQQYNFVPRFDINEIHIARTYIEADSLKVDLLHRNNLGVFDKDLALARIREEQSIFSFNILPIKGEEYLLNLKHRQNSFPPETQNVTPPLWNYMAYLDLSKSVSSNEIVELRSLIYPNPSCDFIYIESEKNIGLWSLFSLDGDLIRKGTNINNKINISDLSVGTYIINLENRFTNFSYKFTKI